MRTIFVMLALLLAGCSDATPDEQEQEVEEPVGVEDAEPTLEVPVDLGYNTTVFDDSFDLIVSATMPGAVSDRSPWFMASVADVDEIDQTGLSGVLIEILYTSDLAGGGAAWLGKAGTPTDNPVIYAKVAADEGQVGSLFVTAEEFAEAEDPYWTVSGGGTMPYAVHGTIRLVVTAFYGQEPGDWSGLA